MTQCQIRVITNGYILSFMDGNELVELAYTDREEMFSYLKENVSASKWEEWA